MRAFSILMRPFLVPIIGEGKVKVDNITHSLFGAAVSESLWALLPVKKKNNWHPKTRRVFLLTSVLANNCPDLDILYSRWMHANPQLGNLLHHRGHTHTVLIALLQSLLLLGLTKLVQKVKDNPFKTEWSYVSLLAFLGPLTHILLDGLNNYGVHPFWPLDNGWKYGDLVFVLEPWAWVTFSLFLFFLASTKKMKLLFAFFPLFGLSLTWFLGVVPLTLCIILTSWALLLIAIMFRATDKSRVSWNWILLGLVLVFFRWSYLETRFQVNTELSHSASEYKVEDISLSPLPVNPFCWAIVTTESNSEFFRLRRGIIAPFPRFLPIGKCTQLKFFSPQIRSADNGGNQIWEQEHRVALDEFRMLREKYCDVRDFLRFARAPFFWREGEDLYFSDLRFERNGGKSFAKIKISSRTSPCPESKAPWEEPMHHLFLDRLSK